jgi:hypothetical protein
LCFDLAGVDTPGFFRALVLLRFSSSEEPFPLEILIGRFATDSPSHPSEQNRLAGDPGFGGSFDFAPGGSFLAGGFCGGASLRMTRLVFDLAAVDDDGGALELRSMLPPFRRRTALRA